MPEPYRANATRRDEQALLAQLVGDPDLPVCWLFDSEGDHRLFYCLVDTVLGHSFLSTYLSEGKLSAGLI